MCQSKAEGGRRCSFHLEQGVCNGMCAFAASVTGLTPKESGAAYQALVREGEGVPDPTREEVDEFLENQIFRARHEPDLTEKRRESIIGRLKAAIGRVTPSGATFHAWKNLVAESWARVRRKAATAFVVGALTFSVGACGNVPHETHEPDRAQNVAAAPATPGVHYDTSYQDSVKPQHAPNAVAKYGQKQVAQGAELAVGVTEDYAYSQDLLTSVRPAGQDQILALGDQLTPHTRKEWEGMVDRYIHGTEKQRIAESSNIFALTFYDAFQGSVQNGKPLDINREGPAAINPKVTQVSTGLDTTGRLSVEVKSQADLRVTAGGQPRQMHVNRDITYWLVNTDQGWKIDAWHGEYQIGAVHAEPAAPVAAQ